MLGSGVGIVVVFFPGKSAPLAGKSQNGAAALLLGRRPHHLAHIRETLEVVRLRRRSRDHLRRKVRRELWVMLRRGRGDRLLLQLGRGWHRGAASVPRGRRRRLVFVWKHFRNEKEFRFTGLFIRSDTWVGLTYLVVLSSDQFCLGRWKTGRIGSAVHATLWNTQMKVNQPMCLTLLITLYLSHYRLPLQLPIFQTYGNRNKNSTKMLS